MSSAITTPSWVALIELEVSQSRCNLLAFCRCGKDVFTVTLYTCVWNLSLKLQSEKRGMETPGMLIVGDPRISLSSIGRSPTNY